MSVLTRPDDILMFSMLVNVLGKEEAEAKLGRAIDPESPEFREYLFGGDNLPQAIQVLQEASLYKHANSPLARISDPVKDDCRACQHRHPNPSPE